MEAAYDQALIALRNDEVPVGAVVVLAGKIIGKGHNQVIRSCSVAMHAEVVAINAASRFISNYRLVGADIYITLEPCHMCAKAIIDARIANIFFSTVEPKTGCIVSIDNFLDKDFLNHQVNYAHGFLQNKCSELLVNFFKDKRA